MCAGHVQQLGGESPLSSLMVAKAFAYALNQWPALTYYANDGWVEIDNNIAENALRAVSLGRKNFLFFGSDHGGERGALLYSLIGTCKLNDVDPRKLPSPCACRHSRLAGQPGQRTASVAHSTAS